MASMIIDLQAGDRMVLLACLIQGLSDLVPDDMADERDHLNAQITAIFEQCLTVDC
jgi:hypothetical protein